MNDADEEEDIFEPSSSPILSRSQHPNHSSAAAMLMAGEENFDDDNIIDEDSSDNEFSQLLPAGNNDASVGPIGGSEGDASADEVILIDDDDSRESPPRVDSVAVGPQEGDQLTDGQHHQEGSADRNQLLPENVPEPESQTITIESEGRQRNVREHYPLAQAVASAALTAASRVGVTTTQHPDSDIQIQSSSANIPAEGATETTEANSGSTENSHQMAMGQAQNTAAVPSYPSENGIVSSGAGAASSGLAGDAAAVSSGSVGEVSPYFQIPAAAVSQLTSLSNAVASASNAVEATASGSNAVEATASGSNAVAATAPGSNDVAVIESGSNAVATVSASRLNDSAADFQTEDDTAEPTSVIPVLAEPKRKKEKKGKKRKAAESVEDDDEGSCCTICFEPWSNSGDHRVASLRCGHFFGYNCIEKWLRGSGSSCPNCNEKSTKKDIRVHFIAKLKAIDTSEKDRALADLEKERSTNRELTLRIAEYQVRDRLKQEQIDKLQREVHQYRKFRGDLPTALQSSQPSTSSSSFTNSTRLTYHKRYEVVRPGNDKNCRVLAFSSYLGMLLLSQPSFTALAPGFGVRQFNVLNLKMGNFISLAKDQIRDLSFSRVSSHLLLSCGQDKTARITNMMSGQKVVEFQCEHQVWACDWSPVNDHQIFLGTQRGTVLVYDTRQPDAEPTTLPFPDGDKRPVIGLRSVPAKPEAGFPNPGFLVINLTSLWYWTQEQDNTWSFYKLNLDQKMLWSLDFESESFLVLVGCKPSPLAVHQVLELNSAQVDTGRVYTARAVMAGRGGSFNQRSFLRSALLPSPSGQVFVAFSKGSGQTDHKVIIQEVGSERTLQELKVDKPVIDIKPVSINDDRYLALLGETDLVMYKWSSTS